MKRHVEPCVIREGEPGDKETIARYNASLAEETEELALDEERLVSGVEAVLDDPERGRYYLAERGGSVVGQLMITREWSDWRAGWFWWIQSVYVDKAERGQGVFRALYDHVYRLARSTHLVVGLRLYVEPHNEAAIAAYLHSGMERADYEMYEIDWGVRRGR